MDSAELLILLLGLAIVVASLIAFNTARLEGELFRKQKQEVAEILDKLGKYHEEQKGNTTLKNMSHLLMQPDVVKLLHDLPQDAREKQEILNLFDPYRINYLQSLEPTNKGYESFSTYIRPVNISLSETSLEIQESFIIRYIYITLKILKKGIKEFKQTSATPNDEPVFEDLLFNLTQYRNNLLEIKEYGLYSISATNKCLREAEDLIADLLMSDIKK